MKSPKNFEVRSSLLGHRNSTGLYSQGQECHEGLKSSSLYNCSLHTAKNQVSLWPETMEPQNKPLRPLLPSRHGWAVALSSGNTTRGGGTLLLSKDEKQREFKCCWREQYHTQRPSGEVQEIIPHQFPIPKE